MDISRTKNGDLLVLTLAGRLDTNWCNFVQNTLAAALREGEHRIHLDLSAVGYISSAGLRVLLAFYKQLRAIQGTFGVVRPSAAVSTVLELAGLWTLIVTESTSPTAPVAAPVATSPQIYDSARATGEVLAACPSSTRAGVKLAVIGDPRSLGTGLGDHRELPLGFDNASFALGLGALGATFADCAPRLGEFLAVAGVAAFLPADGSSRPDFLASQGALIPEGYLALGLSGEGNFPTLLRFEAKKEYRTVPFAELARSALDLSAAPAAAFVAIAETAGIVGASLRRSPAPSGHRAERFGFPQIRDWLSFTSERAFRDTTALVVGVVARPGSALDPVLRPLPAASGAPQLLGHAHAAVFPYRPLRKGAIALRASVHELFEGATLQSVLHLIADPREFNGAGDSEFRRGALWVAPVTV